MLDIRLVRENPDLVRARLATRGNGAEAAVDEVLELDRQRRAKIQEVERLKSARNTISREIGVRKSRKEAADDLLTGMREKSDLIARLDAEVAAVDGQLEQILLRTPNLPHARCPAGASAADNPEVGRYGSPAAFEFKPLDHVALAERLGLADFAAAAKISGSGFLVFTGAGARLERALINFLLDLHTREHGFTEVNTPFVVRAAAMQGTGQLPKFHEDMYRVEGEDLFLVPTAEVPVTNLYREELLTVSDLPVYHAAYTPCFRREAGSAGRETRGMTRVHQFDKIELVKIVEPATSYDELEKLRRNAERALELLGLHYRTIELCAGDLGFGAAKCYDVEVWAPGTGAYLEVSSCSNCEDFQARRMNLRYKNAEQKNVFCHTLNGSGTALPRLFIALTETYQQADGNIKLPEVLRPYFGDTIIK
ncbi:MAG: serine--tRNA ligase [Verrucomicrobiales bacterium]|jgi:seryl-tRNA synthetase|nr:serine--tRNA ligase [Verrucomicrobiales bacterium]